MTDRRWHEIWQEQCRGAETIKLCFGADSAFDYVAGEKLLNFTGMAADNPKFARALPQFVSKIRHTFSSEEIDRHLVRIERRRREWGETAMDDDNPPFEDPEAAARRARQFELVKEPLTAPALGTS